MSQGSLATFATAWRRPLGLAGVLLFLLLAGVPGWGAPTRRVEIDMSPHGKLRWDRGQRPALMALPRRGEGWIKVASRLGGSSDLARRLRLANPGLTQPKRGQRLRFPMELLRGDLRLQATQRLFAADRRVQSGWEHWVLDPFGGGEESWEWLAELFTGRPTNAGLLHRANPDLAGSRPHRQVIIPEAHLLRIFRSQPVLATPTPVATATPATTPTPTATAPPGPSPTPTPVGGNRVLRYARDSRGEHAIYRLRRGEALYSAVVVRFTGELHAKQVNALAKQIARRSGIRDVTDIPVGFAIRIPLDLLLPEYLPAGDPRRREWEEAQRELGRWLEVVRAVDLSGVQVILDPGHGGQDTGAVVGGLWEATYAYDLMCRIKRNLERHTQATVWSTIRDNSRSYTVPAQELLPQDRDQVLLTDPPYALEDSTTGVHLRWYLANDIIRARLAEGVPQSKMVFISIHADSLHSSVRGTMVYVPARSGRPSTFTVNRSVMRRFAEFRRYPAVSLSAELRARTEASSRRLAERILGAVREDDLAVHPYEPIRDRIKQGKKRYVPAVLRYSLAQHAILIECCNLGNPEDRASLKDPAWRERFSQAVVSGLAAAFGEGP